MRAAFVAAVLFAAPAFAQDPAEHDWITEFYGAGCCVQSQHCFPVRTDQVTRSATGATVRWQDKDGTAQVKVVPQSKIQPSLDPEGRTWFCTYGDGCLFVIPET